MFCGFPYVGNALGVAQLRERRTLVNVGNRPHRDNGEGVAVIIPPPYPLGQAHRSIDRKYKVSRCKHETTARRMTGKPSRHKRKSRCVNTPYNTNPTTVRIIHAAHPLRGQCVSVRQTLQRGGEPHLLVERPDGRTQLIPSTWTDQVSVESATGARFTPRQLLALRRWLDDHLRSAPLDKSGHIVSPEKNSSGGNDDELERPISSRPAGCLAESRTARAETATGFAGKVDAAVLEGSTGFDPDSRRVERRS